MNEVRVVVDNSCFQDTEYSKILYKLNNLFRFSIPRTIYAVGEYFIDVYTESSQEDAIDIVEEKFSDFKVVREVSAVQILTNSSKYTILIHSVDEIKRRGMACRI